MSVISLMQYIAEYCDISQCSTIGLSTQSKYASTVLKYFSSITHNTHVSNIRNFLLAIIVILYFNITQPNCGGH